MQTEGKQTDEIMGIVKPDNTENTDNSNDDVILSDSIEGLISSNPTEKMVTEEKMLNYLEKNIWISSSRYSIVLQWRD